MGVHLAGPTARAIAVYAEAVSAETGAPDHTRAAHEQGFEGVACVDDAARAVVLYCMLWQRDPRPAYHSAALGLAQFVAYMQDDDGRFANFILDWRATKNLTGSTSTPGGPAWQARVVHALACVIATFGGHAWDACFQRGIRWLDDPLPYLDVRAVGVLGTIQHWLATGEPRSAERAVAWSTEIAEQVSTTASWMPMASPRFICGGTCRNTRFAKPASLSRDRISSRPHVAALKPCCCQCSTGA